jgi:Type III secretion protein (HpaP)
MSKLSIASMHTAPTLAALPTRARAPAEARAGAGIGAPTARAPREAGSQFAALLDAHPVDASPTPAPIAAHQVVLETTRAPTPPAPHAQPERPRQADRADAEPRAVVPAAAGAARTAAASARQYESPRAPPRVVRATSAADDIERLIDELAEFVLRQPGTRAQSWSVTLWLRAAVLRDTRLTMSGEPGRITIRFATDNAASLRWLHTGHEALQARLRERICVPTLEVTIDAVEPAPHEARV